MGTVAFAWELGANFGHLSRQLGPAMELRRQGHDVVFIVCDTMMASQLLTAHGFAFLQAPVVPRGVRRERRPTLNYSSLLASYGYTQPGLLRSLLQAWMHLWREIEPDVVVIDHSPTALLATRALGIPSVQLGTGFFVPPDHDPLPSIQPWHPVPASQLAKIDAEVLQAINGTLKAMGHAGLSRIGDLFTHSVALLTTFAELDHYLGRVGGTYVGPLLAATDYPSIEWKPDRGPRIFGYLRASMPGFDALLAVLCSLRAQVRCVIPDAPPAMRARLTHSGIELRTQPADMHSALRGCDLMVGYGGTGTVIQALLEGVPQLLVPQEIEQGLVARRTAQIGAALVATRHAPDALREQIDRLLTQPSFASAARSFATRYASFDNDDELRRVAAIITSAAARDAYSAVS